MLYKKTISIYIHWPFCVSKCPYCDFNSHVARQINHRLWEDAYISSINHFRNHLDGVKINSIFFGGGTPSLMPPELVNNLIQHISKAGIVDESTEITLEANPSSVESSKFQHFRNAGINRLSLGVQSLSAQDLNFLGRKHTVNEALEAMSTTQKVFSNHSFDLIYTRPNQDVDEWIKELDRVMEFNPNHISLYQLTIERGTKFYTLYKRGEIEMPDDETSVRLYEVTDEYLDGKGLYKYEISNYAKPGYECRHNLAYWNYDEYLGIGPGAHSRLLIDNDLHAMSMYYNPDTWLSQTSSAANIGIQKVQKLKKEEILTEIIIMGLRLTEGILSCKLKRYLNTSLQEALNSEYLDKFYNLALITFQDGNLKLTQDGVLLYNHIVEKLLPA